MTSTVFTFHHVMQFKWKSQHQESLDSSGSEIYLNLVHEGVLRNPILTFFVSGASWLLVVIAQPFILQLRPVHFVKRANLSNWLLVLS